jgi:periplasmic divalent cation tolerance protein
MQALIVLTNLPDRAAAERLAEVLVAGNTAACVNILAPCRSVYRWKDAVQHDDEHPMLIKTTRERYAALEQALKAGHPYELPEIIAMPIERGLPAYLDLAGAVRMGAAADVSVRPGTAVQIPTGAAIPTDEATMNPTGQQLLIILLVVLLLFGAKRLPDLARSMGSSIKEFRSATKDALQDGSEDGTEGETSGTSSDTDQER